MKQITILIVFIVNALNYKFIWFLTPVGSHTWRIPKNISKLLKYSSYPVDSGIEDREKTIITFLNAKSWKKKLMEFQ